MISHEGRRLLHRQRAEAKIGGCLQDSVYAKLF